MIAETEIHYRADAVVPRRRGVSKVLLAGSVGVEIPEVAGEDAPVVLEHGPKGVRIRVRSVGGLLYTSPMDLETREETAEAAGGFVRAGLSALSLCVDPPREGWRADPVSNPVGRKVAENPKEILSDQLDRIRSAAQEIASRDMVAVDGVLHLRVRSPLIRRSLMAVAGIALPTTPKEGVAAWFHDFGNAAAEILDREDEIDDVGATSFLLKSIGVDVVDQTAFEACRARLAENVSFGRIPREVAESVGQYPHEDLAFEHGQSVSRPRSLVLEALAAIVTDDPPETLAQAVDAVRSLAMPLRRTGLSTGRYVSGPVAEEDAVAPIAIPYPEMLPGRTSWYAHAPKDSRATRIAEVAATETDPADVVEVSVHPMAAFGRTLHDGRGFLATSVDLALLPDAEALSRRPKHELAEIGLKLFVESVLLSENGGRVHDRANHDGFGLSVRRSGSTIRRDGDEEAAERILEEYAAHRIVRIRGGDLVYRCPEPLVGVFVPAVGRPSLEIRHSWCETIRGGDAPLFMFRLDAWDEAMAFMDSTGRKSESWHPKPESVDPSLLSFDVDLWNLKASLCRIVDEIDERVRLMPRRTVEALARTVRFLDTWRMEAALSDVEGHEAELVDDAGMFLAELRDPLYDDIGAEWVREFAQERLGLVRARLRVEPERAADEDRAFQGLAM